ncbi:DUF4241 domain-containing protein [Hyalangium rubrum]|uniref:DUF4241 domain-containing protein n=1 Tax=Hyalangium rubrum TaxID=3103134 RepID=A0ABU5HEV4_9BACT|nr:DUF4241 domain-containing protein [Hyalangium sp. s54d21]MDY7231994.1 DUF4241 domain-containing protein [Hyalangium sp. s54d21]
MAVRSTGPDLLSAFENERVLLSRGRPVAVYTHHAGTLVLTSGRIVVCNPLTLPPRPLPGAHLLVLLTLNHREPFSRAVPPGRYPVLLSVIRTRRTGSSAAHESIAMAMVRFEESRPVRWERATRGEPARVLPPHPRHGYRAEPDITAFLDADVVERVPDRSRQFVDTFTAHSSPMWSSTALTLEPRSGANIIAFSSPTPGAESRAQGVSTSWWGLGEDGQPVCLVTDFLDLDLSRPALPDDAEARLGRIRDLVLQLRYGDAEMRGRALREIGDYGGEAAEAVESVLERILSTESDAAEREYAAAAIARICAEAPEQVELLARALAAPVGTEALAALLRAVGSIGICRQEARFFHPIAERVLTVLIQRLDEGDRHIQSGIKSFVWDLGAHRPEAWDLLVRLLSTADVELRVAAASRLSHSEFATHHEAALDALATVIMDELLELELRVAAASSLRAFPRLSVSARTALWNAASSKQPLLAWYARDMLRQRK